VASEIGLEELEFVPGVNPGDEALIRFLGDGVSASGSGDDGDALIDL